VNLITRKEAQAAGLKKYFTGKPCKEGHVSERYVNGGCIGCEKIKGTADARAWLKEKAEKDAQYAY
jgi:hypothetical protein